MSAESNRLMVLLPVWMVILGVLVWRSGLSARVLVRPTHLAAIPLAVLLCAYGVLALQAAGRGVLPKVEGSWERTV